MNFSWDSLVHFRGSFDTTVSDVPTKVVFKITGKYEVHAHFRSHEVNYTFVINQWVPIQESKKNPVTSFDKFALIMFERYGDTSDRFGLVSREGQSLTIKKSSRNLADIISYATQEVFICAEQIIKVHKRSLLDYCIFHIDLGLCDTYEHYIHLVACRCLVSSNYVGPGIKYHPVEFYGLHREYNEHLFNKIKWIDAEYSCT